MGKINEQDRIDIESMVLLNGWGQREVYKYACSQNKDWPRTSLYNVVANIQKRGSREKMKCGVKPVIKDNPTIVEEIKKRRFPEGNEKPQTQRDIAKALGISRGSVRYVLENEQKNANKRSLEQEQKDNLFF